MKPTQCPSCQSGDLAHGNILSYGPVAFDLPGFFLPKTVRVYGAVCLTCGVVTSYLDEAALNKVRTWNAKTAKAKATIDEL